MHAAELVNKRLLISFKKIQGFENVHRLTSLMKNALIPNKKILSTPALKERGVKKFHN